MSFKIPMPVGDTNRALVWLLEVQNMPFSDDRDYFKLIDDNELENCTGFKKYEICTKTIQTQRKATCLVPLSIGFYRITTDRKSLQFWLWSLVSYVGKRLHSLREHSEKQKSFSKY